MTCLPPAHQLHVEQNSKLWAGLVILAEAMVQFCYEGCWDLQKHAKRFPASLWLCTIPQCEGFDRPVHLLKA